MFVHSKISLIGFSVADSQENVFRVTAQEILMCMEAEPVTTAVTYALKLTCYSRSLGSFHCTIVHQPSCTAQHLSVQNGAYRGNWDQTCWFHSAIVNVIIHMYIPPFHNVDFQSGIFKDPTGTKPICLDLSVHQVPVFIP